MKNNSREEELKRKRKRYERLGARQFQQVVFWVERIKYSILLTCFPQITTYYEKFLTKSTAKKIKKCQTDQEKKALLENSRYQKLLFRKEMNHRKNRNYHYHPGYSQELIPYLEWNKRIHQKELKKNIGIIALCLPIILFSTPSGILFPLCIGLSIVEMISAVINFECINLQDYNLTRIKQNEKLKRIEEKIMNRDLHQYSSATKVIASSLEKSTDIPSVQSLKQEITTKEELENLKQILLYLKQNQLQENLSPKHKVYRKEKES